MVFGVRIDLSVEDEIDDERVDECQWKDEHARAPEQKPTDDGGAAAPSIVMEKGTM